MPGSEWLAYDAVHAPGVASSYRPRSRKGKVLAFSLEPPCRCRGECFCFLVVLAQFSLAVCRLEAPFLRCVCSTFAVGGRLRGVLARPWQRPVGTGDERRSIDIQLGCRRCANFHGADKQHIMCAEKSVSSVGVLRSIPCARTDISSDALGT
jgi:hypothetical protein